ncbi:hypothetical protein VTL71DRAFT_7222 [Oculimacula yallundae]|uniref:Uncharacterized protein n=1 Tax=Oculimacula yallundae TaxID=86028 RepID=A0ABR4BW31_9HELO
MSESNPLPNEPTLVSANMIDEWSYLLPDPESSAFVKSCTGAGANEGCLQSILIRYFSTWKTTLMEEDLSRLQLLAMAKYEQIRCYVKVVWLEDETGKITFDDVAPYDQYLVIWPRLGDGRIAAECLGVELLKTMLVSQQLRPDRLKIRDKRSEFEFLYKRHEPPDPEVAAILARNILDGADLAVNAITIRLTSAYETMITAEISAEHQGQGVPYSLVRKADLCFTSILNPYSYWADRILLHGPALKELRLSFSQPGITPRLPSFGYNDTKFELSSSSLRISTIMKILSNSQQSLTGISFWGVKFGPLGEDATWVKVLSRIANEFPRLAWFQLTNLSEGYLASRSVNFLSIMDKDLLASEPYKSGLEFRERGPDDYSRIPHIVYKGPNASHVLGIIAECAVAKERPFKHT